MRKILLDKQKVFVISLIPFTMSTLSPSSSPINVVQEKILNFISDMKPNRVIIEDEIKQRTEQLRAAVGNVGRNQFTFQEISQLLDQQRDFFIDQARNSYLTFLARSSTGIREGIESVIIDNGDISPEVIASLNKFHEEESKRKLESNDGMVNSGDEQYSDQINSLNRLLLERDEELSQLQLSLNEQREGRLTSSRDSANLVTQLREKLAESDTKLTEIRNELAEARHNSDLYLSEKNALQRSLNLLRDQTQTYYKDAQEMIESLQDKLSDAQKSELNLKSTLHEKDVENQRISSRLKASQSESEGLSESIKKLEGVPQDDRSTTLLEEKERALTLKEKQLNKLSVDHDLQTWEVENLKNQLSALNSEVQERREASAKFELEVIDYKKEIERLSTQAQGIRVEDSSDSEGDELLAQLNNVLDKLREYRETGVSSNEDEIEGLESDDIKDLLSSKNLSIETLEGELKVKLWEVEQQQDLVKEYKGKVEDLSVELGKYDGSAELIVEERDALRRSKGDMTFQLSELLQENADLQSKLTSIQSGGTDSQVSHPKNITKSSASSKEGMAQESGSTEEVSSQQDDILENEAMNALSEAMESDVLDQLASLGVEEMRSSSSRSLSSEGQDNLDSGTYENQINELRLDKQGLEVELNKVRNELSSLELELNKKNGEISQLKIDYETQLTTTSLEGSGEWDKKLQKLRQEKLQIQLAEKYLRNFISRDPKYQLLFILNDLNAPLTFEELCEILQLPMDYIVKLISELEEAEFVYIDVKDNVRRVHLSKRLNPPQYLVDDDNAVAEAL